MLFNMTTFRCNNSVLLRIFDCCHMQCILRRIYWPIGLLVMRPSPSRPHSYVLYPFRLSVRLSHVHISVPRPKLTRTLKTIIITFKLKGEVTCMAAHQVWDQYVKAAKIWNLLLADIFAQNTMTPFNLSQIKSSQAAFNLGLPLSKAPTTQQRKCALFDITIMQATILVYGISPGTYSPGHSPTQTISLPHLGVKAKISELTLAQTPDRNPPTR